MPSSFISNLSAILSNLFFPQTCLFCKTGNQICCQECFGEIPQNVRLQNNILSIYHFSEPKIDKLIWQLKYHHSGDIAKLFGCIMAGKLEKILFPIFPPTTQNIYLIPIPLNQGDKRLHNHAELLAREIQNHLTLPSPWQGEGSVQKVQVEILNNLLIKNSKQKQSHTKGRQERFENIKGAFSVKHPLDSTGSRINPSLQKEGEQMQNIYIIIDDVTTSGATISEARKALSPFLHTSESSIFAITIAY